MLLMSARSSVFDMLSSSLTHSERSDLLEKLTFVSAGNEDQLLPETDASEEVETTAEVISRMGILHRIVLMVKSFFTRRDLNLLVEDEILDSISRRLIHRYPDTYQYRTGTLGASLISRISELKSKIKVLHEPMKSVFTGDKKEFLAFLGSTLLPVEHEKLDEAANPESVTDIDRENEFELRKQVQISIRDALTSIEKSSRQHLYSMYRAMYFLNELVFFPFGKIVADGEQPVSGVDGNKYRKDLSDLCDLFASLRIRPSNSALHALLLFHHRQEIGEPELKTTLESEAVAASDAVDEVLRFCREIPLIDILKLMNRNPQYAPEVLGGGEDWFTFFRQFWEERAEASLAKFLHRQRFEGFHRDAEQLFGAGLSIQLETYVSSSETFPGLLYPETAALLCGIGELIFLDRNARLRKTFLVNGEFYKAQNRADLTDAFRGMEEMGPHIRSIDAALSASGELGGELTEAEQKFEDDPIKESRLRSVVERANERIEEEIRESIRTLDLLIQVLRGVLFGEGSGSYDTLSNIQAIGGSENKALLLRLETCIEEFGEAKRLLHLIFDLENTVATA